MDLDTAKARRLSLQIFSPTDASPFGFLYDSDSHTRRSLRWTPARYADPTLGPTTPQPHPGSFLFGYLPKVERLNFTDWTAVVRCTRSQDTLFSWHELYTTKPIKLLELLAPMYEGREAWIRAMNGNVRIDHISCTLSQSC